MIDLRSDTVTRPTPAMRQAMAEAEVGDDVFGEDPTILALQRQVATLLGKEAALFVPSGTMANQIAVGAQAGPSDEILVASTSHVFVWEGGGIARLWGITPRIVEVKHGLLTVADLVEKVRPDDVHQPRTRLVCLENTHNRGGGRIHPYADFVAVTRWAHDLGLAVHLDGARLLNAVVASGIAAADWAKPCDTVSLCFSKGLGAPVGSVLAGSSETIRAAHRLRKVLGGGMRQAGILAAAALHALDHNIDRLAEDHANAQVLARAVENTPGLRLEQGPVETNLVWVEVVDPALGTAREIGARLKAEGVLVAVLGPRVFRACTHLDVSTADVERAAAIIERLGRSRGPTG